MLTYKYDFNKDAYGRIIGGEPMLTQRDKNTMLHLYNDKWLAKGGGNDSPPSGSGTISPSSEPKHEIATEPKQPESMSSLLAAMPYTQSASTGVTGAALGAPASTATNAPMPSSPASTVSTTPTSTPTTPGSASSQTSTSPLIASVNPQIAAQYAAQHASELDELLGVTAKSGDSQSDPTRAYSEYVSKGIECIKSADYDGAITALEEACKIVKPPTIAERNLVIALTSKANKAYASQNYAQAAESYKNAISLRLKVYGPKDPKVVETMPALIYSLRKAGLVQEADQWQSQVLK
jgi:hypothetical protein